MAVFYGAVGGDEVGFGCAIDAEVGDEAAVRVAQVQTVGVAVAGEEGGGVRDFVGVVRRPVDADDGDLLAELQQVGVFVVAGGTPAAPDVEQVGLALRQVGAGVACVVAVESRQINGRQGFAGGNGGQFLRVFAEAADKEGDEGDEGSQREDGEGFAVHGVGFCGWS